MVESINVSIVDPSTGHRLKVNGENEISVTLHSHPNLSEDFESYPFVTYFKNSAGSSDMIVDGSSTPREFFVQASVDRDIFIKTLDLQISDTTVALSNFGGLPALANGLKMVYSTPEIGEEIIADGLHTNLELIRLFGDTPAVGSDASAFRAGLVGAATDTYIMKLDMDRLFGYPWGLHLKKKTIAKISFFVNDNLAGLTTLNIKAFGIKI